MRKKPDNEKENEEETETEKNKYEEVIQSVVDQPIH